MTTAAKLEPAPSVSRNMTPAFAQAGGVQYAELTFFGDMRYHPKGRLMLRNVHLYGALAEEFGDSFRFETEQYG